MNLLHGIALSVGASVAIMVVPVTSMAQPTNAEAASLQKKASEAQARIHANKNDRDQLMVAVKINEVP